MAEESTKPPKVFISYAWEEDVKIWVRALAKQLRKNGVETILDQWDTHYGDPLPEFMEKAVRESDFVILVCTPKYKKKSDEREGGVGYEGHIITSEIFQNSNHRKFIPVLRKGSWGSALPSWAAGKLSIDLSGDPYSQKNYQDLLRVLHGKWYAAPPVGPPPDFPDDEEDDDDPKKLKLPQFNFDPKIAFRVFLGIIVLMGIILGVPRLANYFSQIEFPTPFPKSTSTFTQIFTPPAPTLTLTPALPMATNTPVFTPILVRLPTDTPVISSSASDEFTDAKGFKMRLVPVGTFTMGSEKYDNEKPIHEVYLDDYYMDIYEVTNAAYKQCVDDGTCKPPTHTSKHNDSQYAQHPVAYVDWNMAKTYCEWRGAKLPTEAEWEKAARGTDGRTYPWGEGLDCTKANYSGCKNSTTPVGSYESGKSPYGMYDMAGNVWEWVNDWYGETYYQDSPSSNPLGPDSGQYRVLRGGSWLFNSGYVRTANRDWFDPTNSSTFIGFRCSRSLP